MKDGRRYLSAQYNSKYAVEMKVSKLNAVCETALPTVYAKLQSTLPVVRLMFDVHVLVGPIKKGWWTIVSLGAICGLIFNMYSITTNYMSFPTNINIKVEHQTELTFPSVTICNMSPVKRSLWSQKYGSVSAAAHVTGSKRRRKRAGRSMSLMSCPCRTSLSLA